MSLTKHYKLDTKKETEGVEIKLSPNDDKTIPTFIVARAGGRTNKRYQKALERNSRPVAAQLRTKTLGNEAADGLLMSSFIEGALIGWQNILLSDVTGEIGQDPNSKAEFTPENATMLFARLPELYSDLQLQANDVALFREDDLEQASKN